MTEHAVGWDKVGKFGMCTKVFTLANIRREIHERDKIRRKRLIREPHNAAEEREAKEAEIARMQAAVRAKAVREELLKRQRRVMKRCLLHEAKRQELVADDDASLADLEAETNRLKNAKKKLRKIQQKLLEL